MAAAAPAALAAWKRVPIGLELYSVRNELQKDPMGTVRQVAAMGYECVEFYGPYYSWTVEQAKEMRKLLDDLNLKCLSTHNDGRNFLPERIDHAIELNKIIGSRYIVAASAGRIEGLDGWKKFADQLNAGAAKMKSAGIKGGFHNHQTEFKPIDGVRPMDVLAKNTTPDVILQLDVGTCLEAGQDPVAWINQTPGRIESIHMKEWSDDPAVGYKALFGEGKAPWKQIMEAAESKGGIQFYLIEQEGSRFTPMETAQKCLENIKKMRAA